MSELDQIIKLERRLEEATKENDALRAQISTGDNYISNERYALEIAASGSGIL